MRVLSSLRAIKLAHTVIWALFVACIAGAPLAAAMGRLRAAWLLSAAVWGECLVLAANYMRCPLTDLAAPLTDDRAANFDIYLPAWLACYNKHIFGPLFFAGELFLVWRTLGQ